ncbi:uncharacterized protein TNCT_174201 [Trichonephila clavata]|uniref:Uncharacterized protein n=1 Tax=Trichonephila clavata TaxID=2740835 RepID=A0A8X6JLC3_TRICU|nr:uncharacterized protein TNCT_174201 [Trichonephila clavata]
MSMDSASSCPPCPRKALFQKQRPINVKHAHIFRKAGGYEKSDRMSLTKLKFEHELTLTMKVLEKELHTQRLEQLRSLSEKLKEDAWLYPDLETTLGI